MIGENDKMIYLDNAATTFPKPDLVLDYYSCKRYWESSARLWSNSGSRWLTIGRNYRN